MNGIIKVQHLTKTYKVYRQHIDRLKETLHPFKKSYHKDFDALHNVNFTIKRGEVVGIIGRNGSGKSTLLKMLTGVLTPTDGSVYTKGKIAAILELGSGFNPELTGIENIYLNSSINGLNKKKTDAIVEEIIAFSELEDFIHQPLKTYSSGMKARLGFAFAINIKPEILIIDEALSVGDVAFQRKCYAKIEHMCESDDITVLFVSHSGGAIKQLCSRAILLSAGEVMLDGNPNKVINLYEKHVGSKKIDKEKIQKEFTEMQIGKEKQEEIPFVKSSFNPNLKSKSCVPYEENGAKIYDIILLDETGQQVNIINKYEAYTYQYKVIFFDEYKNIRFTTRIKNTSGIIISGVYKACPLVKRGEIYVVSFKFTNILNPGEYFTNCGVNSREFGEKIVLHRIVDNYMFVVNQNSDTSNALVDFKFENELELQ